MTLIVVRWVHEIDECLAQRDDVRNSRIRGIHDEEAAGPIRTQPGHGRKRADTSFERTIVQGGQGPQGCGKRALTI